MPLRIDLVYDAERGPGHAIARIHDQRAVPGRIEMSVLRNSDQFYLRADGSWASSESWLPLPEAAHILVFKDQGGNLLTLNPQDDGQTITLSSPVAKTAMTLGAGTDNPS
ncbi:MAG: hypothetical protein JHC88_08815 [Niveispirillum sp.]|nr:hypothetical protein [Niveispirillum sp.]